MVKRQIVIMPIKFYGNSSNSNFLIGCNLSVYIDKHFFNFPSFDVNLLITFPINQSIFLAFSYILLKYENKNERNKNS